VLISLKMMNAVAESQSMALETSTTPSVPRPRAARRVGAVAALALLVGLLLASCTPEAYRSADLVNQTRAQNGRAPLEFNSMLHMKAQAWSEQLSRQGFLSHSNLTDGNWSTSRTKLGENVGYAWSLEQAHNAFLNSAPHRANILDWTYNKVGTGVTTGGDGRIWVVQEFMHENCC
jgi:uncharacterized protein YkwD